MAAMVSTEAVNSVINPYQCKTGCGAARPKGAINQQGKSGAYAEFSICLM